MVGHTRLYFREKVQLENEWNNVSGEHNITSTCCG